MPTRAQLIGALRAADAAGDTQSAQRIAQIIKTTPQTFQRTPAPMPQAQPQPQQPQQPAAPLNWFQRAVNGIGDAANHYARPIAATFRGIQDQIPGIDHLAAAANEVGTVIGANTSNMTYSQRVQALQAQRQAEMNQDVHGPSTAAAVGHYAGEIGGALGTGMAEVKAAGAIAPIANVMQKMSTAQKVVAGGAAAGAISGAGNTTKLADLATNTGEGAVVGGIAAPLAVGGLKMASMMAHTIGDATSASTAANILGRYISTSADDLAARAAAWKTRTGADPTLFEILPLADRQNVQKMLNIVPSTSKEQAATLIKQRAGNMGQEISDKAQDVIAPQRQGVVDQISQDLANSRDGPGTPPTADETTLANAAARNPSALDTARQTINSNIMAPHDGTQIPSMIGHDPDTGEVVPSTVHDLVPQEPVLQPDGSINQQETQPDVSNLIRNAAGVQNLDKSGVTVSDVTGMISKLRRVANSSPDFIQASTASRAADHLATLLPADAAAAHDAMTGSNQNYKQMLEGWQAGLQGDLRENVSPTGDFQLVKNQYDTPAGAQGRLLGQASALDQHLSLNPGASLSAASDIATSPTAQTAITRNLDATASPVTSAGTPAPGSGSQIADAAQAQTQSAQNLSELNPTPGAQSTDLPGLAANLIRLGAFSPTSKASALTNIMRSLHGLPEAQSTQIVDSLFSQNPAKISQGLKFLNSSGDVGQQALSTLQTSLGASTAAANAGTATPANDPQVQAGTDPSAAPDPAAPDPAAAPDPSAAPAMPADASTATDPYAAKLQATIDGSSQPLLDLASKVYYKETRNRDTNADGTPIVSPKGAVGPMQVMPQYLQEFAGRAGVPVDQTALATNANYNKLVAMHQLDHLMTTFGGDPQKAAAAYNAGPGAVQAAVAKAPTDWLSHLPDETQAYAGDIN